MGFWRSSSRHCPLNLTGAAQHPKRRLLWCVEARMQRVTLIDNYDSFTFNLVHYLGELGADVSVWRNDEITVVNVATARTPRLSLGRARTKRAFVSILARPVKRRPCSGSALAIRRSGRRLAATCARASADTWQGIPRSHNARGLLRSEGRSLRPLSFARHRAIKRRRARGQRRRRRARHGGSTLIVRHLGSVSSGAS